MSKRWVERRVRKLDIETRTNLLYALDRGDVDFVISKVDTSGKVSTYYATSVTDSAGQVTRVKEGAIWP